MPMIPVTLRKQIRFEFPFYKQANVKIVGYIHSLLKILDYCPNLIFDVLELILENLLLIDVNVTREQIEHSEELDEEFSPDEDDVDCDKMKLPVAETLDICMEKIFNYCNEKLRDDADTNKDDQKSMVKAIFDYFDEQILKTYTKHVHFVLFYIASIKVSWLRKSIIFFIYLFLYFRNPSSPNS